MQLRNIILIGLAAAITAALGYLYIQVRSNPAIAIPEQDIQRAEKRHQMSVRSAPSGMVSSLNQDVARSRPETSRTRTRRNPVEEITRNLPPDERPDPPPSPVLSASDTGFAEQDLKQQMDEANSFYNRRDYDAAIEQAFKVLENNPDNVRMLRVVVSSACIMGNEDTAREYYARLPERDQRAMAKRCERYDVTF